MFPYTVGFVAAPLAVLNQSAVVGFQVPLPSVPLVALSPGSHTNVAARDDAPRPSIPMPVPRAAIAIHLCPRTLTPAHPMPTDVAFPHLLRLASLEPHRSWIDFGTPRGPRRSPRGRPAMNGAPQQGARSFQTD